MVYGQFGLVHATAMNLCMEETVVEKTDAVCELKTMYLRREYAANYLGKNLNFFISNCLHSIV